jgi:hypothetical protein
VHKAAVANGSEQEWEREIEAENAGAQIAIGERDRMARAEGDIFIDAAILAKSDFAFRAAIKESKTARGTRRRARARKSAMLTTRGEATDREDRVIP